MVILGKRKDKYPTVYPKEWLEQELLMVPADIVPEEEVHVWIAVLDRVGDAEADVVVPFVMPIDDDDDAWERDMKYDDIDEPRNQHSKQPADDVSNQASRDNNSNKSDSNNTNKNSSNNSNKNSSSAVVLGDSQDVLPEPKRIITVPLTVHCEYHDDTNSRNFSNLDGDLDKAFFDDLMKDIDESDGDCQSPSDEDLGSLFDMLDGWVPNESGLE